MLGTAKRPFPPGSNRGIMGQAIDAKHVGSVEAFCAEIEDYIKACENDREARTGYRRLEGFR